ncbi:LuxR C-terminal-related transcriptional regulator [Zhongshania aliphaticivorans]|uniref:LuxR C-terminal-related transcriptional regulator n=1 Tax=Zhongshania aliphaticivorans TaxID=1470434 RepID=UPI0012E688B8|nr:response regulator transcription factor [Zhongshania aliphaticivorans]CAA0092451.1 Response regulator protein VraR [Zhongshania aliphaticivorans]
MDRPGFTVIIADDHPLFGVALRLGVQNIAPTAQIVEVADFEGLRNALERFPDASLVLLDLILPDVEGLAALSYLREHRPTLRVAVISALDQAAWVQAAQVLGAAAFIPKSLSATQTQDVLRTVLAGESWWPESETPLSRRGSAQEDKIEDRISRLSPQELRILLMIRDGQLNKQIAGHLGIAESTVKTHISTMLRKLNLASRTQAAVIAQRVLSHRPPEFASPPNEES